MIRLLVLVLIVAGACSKPAPRPDAYWRRTSEHAEPLEQARSACRTYAMERSSHGSGREGMDAKAAAGAFAECMEERGWVLVDRP